MHWKTQLLKSQLIPKPDARGKARCSAGRWNRAILLPQPAITPAFEAGLGVFKICFNTSIRQKLALKEATQATLILHVTRSLPALKEFM